MPRPSSSGGGIRTEIRDGVSDRGGAAPGIAAASLRRDPAGRPRAAQPRCRAPRGKWRACVNFSADDQPKDAGRILTPQSGDFDAGLTMITLRYLEVHQGNPDAKITIVVGVEVDYASGSKALASAHGQRRRGRGYADMLGLRRVRHGAM
jgi:hypothetical protein